MNAQEYEDFKRSYLSTVGKLGTIHSGASHECSCCNPTEESEEDYCGESREEGFFNPGRSCDACGRYQGGTFYPAHATRRRASAIPLSDGYGPFMPCLTINSWETTHLDICQNCVYFATYGRLDDQTMLEIEEGGKP